MKKIYLLICGLILLPSVVYAETTVLTDYEISWGMDDDYICGTSSLDETYDYTNNTCIDYGNEDYSIGTYTNSTATFEFENNAGVYLYGNDALRSTIEVNGSNTIDVIRNGNYVIEGSGQLTIKGLYNYVPSFDENGNGLYFVVFNIDGRQYIVKNEDGSKLTVTTKEEFENIFDEVKEYNVELENIEYSEDDYSLYEDNHMEPITIDEAWINEHISTDLETIYNNDGSITFRSSDYQAEETLDSNTGDANDTNEDDIKANMVLPIIIVASAVLVGGATLLIKRK